MTSPEKRAQNVLSALSVLQILSLVLLPVPLVENSFHLSNQLILIGHIEYIPRSEDIVGQTTQSIMENTREQRIRTKAEKVLERYRNSITRKAFIQFTNEVLAILSDKEDK